MKQFFPIAGLVLAMLMPGAGICLAAQPIEYSTPPPMPILSTDISGSDLEFFMGAGPATALLIQMSAMASKKAVTPEVAAEAALVLKEQTDMAAGLAELAARVQAPVATEPDAAGKAVLQDLAGMTGVKFDKSYLDALGAAQASLMASANLDAETTDGGIKTFVKAEIDTLTREQNRLKKLGM
jgi:hypothetical protein